MTQSSKLRHTPASKRLLAVATLCAAGYFLLDMVAPAGLFAAVGRYACLILALGLFYGCMQAKAPYSPNKTALTAAERRKLLTVSNIGLALVLISLPLLILLPLFFPARPDRLGPGLMLVGSFLAGTGLMTWAELRYQKRVSG